MASLWVKSYKILVNNGSDNVLLPDGQFHIKWDKISWQKYKCQGSEQVKDLLFQIYSIDYSQVNR